MSQLTSGYDHLARWPIVICADDDHAIRALYWHSLWSQGYRCMTCESADAVLEAVRQFPVDLAILDYDMPNPDWRRTGAEMARDAT
jgi:DNA-binding response OmpR family regulator